MPFNIRRTLRPLLLLVMMLSAHPAWAWWSNDWAYRQQITIDTSSSGVMLRDRAYDVPVIIRLHTGNFPFDSIKADGSDLRIIGADDKTPLPFSIERFEKDSGIAILRVLVPTLEPGVKQSVWIYYGNAAAEPAGDRTRVRDRLSVIAFDFEQLKAGLKDRTAFGNNAASNSAAPTPGGVIGDGASFAAGDAALIAPAPSLLFSKAGGISIAFWIRMTGAGSIVTVGDGATPPLRISVAGGGITAGIRPNGGGAAVTLTTGPVAATGWHHVALTLNANTAILYLDGEEKARGAADALPFGGQVALGAGTAGQPGFTGSLDDFTLDKAVRGPEYLRAIAGGNGPQGRIVAMGGVEQKSQYAAYLGLLGAIVSTVSIDGWVIIAFTLLLGLITGEVTITKLIQLNRAQKGDQRFLATDANAGHPDDFAADSPLARIEAAAVHVTQRRDDDGQVPEGALDTVRSAVARTQINEASALNKSMVLISLTIAGAPFLGLLGTVVGVMITFAAIAATGDINVNTIAPGISAALACTVAGLIVAIPAVFSYNILLARIRERLTSMDVFGEDVVTRAAQRLKALAAKPAGASHAL